MTNILYRTSTSATPPVTTSAKGTPMTNLEFDANLKSISDDVASKAPSASPTFTGTPAAPTAAANTNTTQLATTEFVATAIASKAPSASPTFTGTPAAPTAAANTNTTQLATTAYVIAERDATASLTNKTLTAPTITNPTNTEVTLVDGATVNWDMNLGHVAKWTITATGRTLAAPTNYKVGGQYLLFINLTTPATMTPTWPSIIKWNYDIAPDLTTSGWTVISLVWSSAHGKFLGSYSPGF